MSYATVDEVIEILKQISDDGKGDYTLTCNFEYYLFDHDDQPDVCDETKVIDFGGYYE